MAEAYYRETGTGSAVICIHCSASSSRQWQPLMDGLSNRYRLFAPDLHGHGNSPAWRGRRRMRTDDEVSLLEPVFQSAGDGITVIGHSWGGAVALRAALRHRRALRSLILFEPALWSVLVDQASDSSGAQEISQLRDRTVRYIQQENWPAAARVFLDYWVGADTWEGMAGNRRAEVAGTMPAIGHQWHASFQDPISLSDIEAIDIPTLLLTGSDSPAPAKALIQLLGACSAQARTVEIAGAGHMAPMTHSGLVNAVIEDFLLAHRV